MTKILAAMLWPAGLAVIFCTTAVAARRFATAAPKAPPITVRPASAEGLDAPATNTGPGQGSRVPRFAQFCLLVIAGSVVIYAVMVPAGMLAAHAGPMIDRPLLHWTVTHQVRLLRAVLSQVTQVGNTNPSVVAACTGAACLAWSWHKDRWVPPVAIAALVIVAHFLTVTISHTVHRVPPPGSNGTFPSGGSTSAIAVYGLIAYLLWREFSGTRRGAIWTGAAVAALGFSEGFSRGYLAVHWFTDILGGLLYGCLLLGLFIVAVRCIAGPVNAVSTARARAPVSSGDGSPAWIGT